jgi:hypothetical protein
MRAHLSAFVCFGPHGVGSVRPNSPRPRSSASACYAARYTTRVSTQFRRRTFTVSAIKNLCDDDSLSRNHHPGDSRATMAQDGLTVKVGLRRY